MERWPCAVCREPVDDPIGHMRVEHPRTFAAFVAGNDPQYTATLGANGVPDPRAETDPATTECATPLVILLQLVVYVLVAVAAWVFLP